MTTSLTLNRITQLFPDTPEKFIEYYPGIVYSFLRRHPEYNETDILWFPEVFKQLQEETNMTERSFYDKYLKNEQEG